MEKNNDENHGAGAQLKELLAFAIVMSFHRTIFNDVSFTRRSTNIANHSKACANNQVSFISRMLYCTVIIPLQHELSKTNKLKAQ